jgi:hypothetical protein
MRTAVSAAYFKPVGSRAIGSRTVHLMRSVTFTDKRNTTHGPAYCGVDVQGMAFGFLSNADLDARLCKRCKRGERGH